MPKAGAPPLRRFWRSELAHPCVEGFLSLLTLTSKIDLTPGPFSGSPGKGCQENRLHSLIKKNSRKQMLRLDKQVNQDYSTAKQNESLSFSLAILTKFPTPFAQKEKKRGRTCSLVHLMFVVILEALNCFKTRIRQNFDKVK